MASSWAADLNKLGIETVKDGNGTLYLCQMFQGRKIPKEKDNSLEIKICKYT
jgi:hypothetical protein